MTPFLGAGANLCGRPSELEWSPGCGYFPSGPELARHLAEHVAYPDSDYSLMEVASYVEVTTGRGYLYRQLREVFGERVPPSPLHDCLAQYIARNKAFEHPAPLIVTTNYDVALERALDELAEPYDVVAYIAEGDHQGKFAHTPPGAEPMPILSPHRFKELDFDARPTILKIHGSIDMRDTERDNFVITEEHYVEYLTHDVWDMIPPQIVHRMKRSHLLFLGYAMRDWNLLVILQRLGLLPHMGIQPQTWAVQLNQSQLDARRWAGRNVEAFDEPLERYVEALASELA